MVLLGPKNYFPSFQLSSIYPQDVCIALSAMHLSRLNYGCTFSYFLNLCQATIYYNYFLSGGQCPYRMQNLSAQSLQADTENSPSTACNKLTLYYRVILCFFLRLISWGVGFNYPYPLDKIQAYENILLEWMIKCLWRLRKYEKVFPQLEKVNLFFG